MSRIGVTGSVFTANIEAVQAGASTDVFGALPQFRWRAAPWAEECQQRIESLRGLRENWDSYGASPTDLSSLVSAKSLLKEISFINDVPQPTVTASPQGNVALCWDLGMRSVDLEILPGGMVEYVVVDDSLRKEAEGITDRGVQLAGFFRDL